MVIMHSTVYKACADILLGEKVPICVDLTEVTIIAHKQCCRDMITRVIHFNNRTVALLLMTYTDI